jgi:hypothetical protein
MDTTTASGELLFHLFGALARYERAMTKERVVAGLAAARRRGRVGGPPAITGEKLDAIVRCTARRHVQSGRVPQLRPMSTHRWILYLCAAILGGTIVPTKIEPYKSVVSFQTNSKNGRALFIHGTGFSYRPRSEPWTSPPSAGAVRRERPGFASSQEG